MSKSKLGIVINSMIKENPVLVLLLGLCPTLGTSTSAINGMSMGLATTAVLIFSNIIISLIKKAIPDKVRIPAFIMVIASLVTVVQMLMEAYTPDVYKVLGLYIPLIVVNCIVLGRAESFASKNSVIDSMFDGIGSGLGFTLALTILGIIREILGNGTIFNMTIVPASWQPALIFILPPGGFMTIACVIAYQNYLKQKKGA
ncbi:MULTISPECIES: RnfABCDGE type electron transport complex subunit E [Fusobacterium]|uniref:RnfABCDGE type electron transport complex subunit E n=1 Tax=Fusobacterium TaxID=848 RepID=UPI00048912B7|nr:MULTISPECIES: electron transport complex subunit E [Fusobacterium]MCI6151594.1 electron transport complex subunit E [Fusobacterium perfoetens]MDY3237762.1 electron transport complex subunit E [Fusobacterium perfoetens]NME36339.1 electron transport complex subunit E [Fusobacterium sp. FSA-380-WT-3A]